MFVTMFVIYPKEVEELKGDWQDLALTKFSTKWALS